MSDEKKTDRANILDRLDDAIANIERCGSVGAQDAAAKLTVYALPSLIRVARAAIAGNAAETKAALKALDAL